MASSRTTLWVVAALLWTVLIGGIAWKAISISQDTISDLAEVQARASFSDDSAYQKWAAMHGGVYIPVTEETPPSPFLAHMPERDITTPSGKTLTLVNHAYITRQIHEQVNPEYGVKGKITSLNPVRPENGPDAWERKALLAIKTKERVVSGIEFIRGEKHLRMLFPLHIEADCLKCHSRQTYLPGVQYGGISIAVPFAPFQAAIQSTAVKILMMLLSVWALGIGLLLFSFRLVRNQFTIVEAALLETKTIGIKYRTLFDQAAGGICVSDMETGKIIDCNHSLAQLVGRTREELIGRTQSILFPASEQGTPGKEIKKIWRDNRDETLHLLEKQLICKDGSLKDVQIKAAPLQIEGRKLLQGFFYDITIQKKLQTQAIRSSQLASIGELSAGVAHEINNPIGGVINYAQILLNQNLGGPFEQDILNKIINEGQRIARIVKSLLSLSRKGEEKQFIYDLKKIIKEPLDLINAHIIRDGINVTLEAQESLPAIKGNPQQLEQLVLNLLNNSRYALNEKYTGVDKNKKIAISVKEARLNSQRYLMMSFVDHGTGIPPGNISDIKGAFCTTKPSGEGTGLGLSICEEIVSNHGGRLDIESEYGAFTRVAVYLPIAITP